MPTQSTRRCWTFFPATKSAPWFRTMIFQTMQCLCSMSRPLPRACVSCGSGNWQRDKAQRLFDGPVDAWIAAYLAAGPTDRRGFVDSLEFASIEQLHLLGWSALAQLEKQEDLTVIAARASLESVDLDLLQQTISRGSGPEMPRILAAAALEFSPEQSGEVLNYLLHSGSDSKAALAIALLAPGHLDEENIREMLFSTLPKQNLGAAAALVLGASKDKQIQQRLSEIAAGKAGPAQQRAALAISTHQPDVGAMQ